MNELPNRSNQVSEVIDRIFRQEPDFLDWLARKELAIENFTPDNLEFFAARYFCEGYVVERAEELRSFLQLIDELAMLDLQSGVIPGLTFATSMVLFFKPYVIRAEVTQCLPVNLMEALKHYLWEEEAEFGMGSW